MSVVQLGTVRAGEPERVQVVNSTRDCSQCFSYDKDDNRFYDPENDDCMDPISLNKLADSIDAVSIEDDVKNADGKRARQPDVATPPFWRSPYDERCYEPSTLQTLFGGNDFAKDPTSRRIFRKPLRPFQLDRIITNDNIRGLVRRYVRERCSTKEENDAELLRRHEEHHISKWDVSRVTDMYRLFFHATFFNQPIEKWNVEKVIDMSEMFFGATNFNQPIGEWREKVRKVRDMSNMFNGASSFNQPIGEWNVEKVENMRGMFNGASSFNRPIEDWNIKRVTDMSYMFRGASSFNQPIEKWKIGHSVDTDFMFANAVSFNQPKSRIKILFGMKYEKQRDAFS